MDIQLHFFPGTCSRVAMIALEQSGLSFETIVVHNRQGETQTPHYLAMNPLGQVPTLVVDGRPLNQNIAIIGWLNRICPDAGILPAAASEFDKARQVADLSFVSSTLHPLVTRLALPQLFASEDAVASVRSKAGLAMDRFWGIVEQRLADSPWWYGEWSIMDAYLYWVHWVVEGAGIDVSAYPHYAAMLRRLVKHPSVARAMAREERLQTELETRGRGFPAVARPAPIDVRRGNGRGAHRNLIAGCGATRCNNAPGAAASPRARGEKDNMMRDEPTLTIYEHKESVCCHKVALTLAEKNIVCPVVNISLETNEQKEPWYLAINPAGKVPALVHDGHVVTQSTIMTEYLDDTFPDPALMPRDPLGRARRRLWARWLDDEMHSHVSIISFTIAFAQLLRRQMDTREKLDAYLATITDPKVQAHATRLFESDLHSAQMRQALAACDRFLSEMERTLQTSAWLAGDAYGLADIDVIPYIWRLRNLQLDFMWGERPQVTAWIDRITARAAFREAIITPALPEWVETMRSTGAAAKGAVAEIVAQFSDRPMP